MRSSTTTKTSGLIRNNGASCHRIVWEAARDGVIVRYEGPSAFEAEWTRMLGEQRGAA